MNDLSDIWADIGTRENTQSLTVRWGYTYSKKNLGVKWSEARRDLILQAFQYTCIYMNDLSVLLNNSNIGGKIGGILVNHLSYADDMCSISLSSHGMIQLLIICDNFSIIKMCM